MRIKQTSIVTVVTLLAFVAAWASPPELIRYQARLTDDAGVPLTGGGRLRRLTPTFPSS